MTAARKLYRKYGFEPVEEPLFDTGHYTCDVRLLKDLKEE
jgi:putative acetyltransferase